jgi:hypothetical protein
MSRLGRLIRAAQEGRAMARARSAAAESAWQRAAWHQGDNVTLRRKLPAQSPTENSFHPERKGDRPDSVAAAIYPHLKRGN